MAIGDVRRAGARESDAATLARLLQDFNTEYDSPVPEPDVLTGRFARLLARDDVLVLLVERQAGVGAVGFAFTTVRPSAYCDAGVAMLEELYVRPTLRGQGLGSRLVEELLTELAERGVDELQVNVDSVDLDARRFYERHGFTNLEAAGPGEAAEVSQMLLYVHEH